MGVENVVYGLIAGAVIALLGLAFRPRRGEQRLTGNERIEALGWFLVAWFFIIVLQIAGVGKEFAIAVAAAGVALFVYLLVRRPTRTIARRDTHDSPRRRAG